MKPIISRFSTFIAALAVIAVSGSVQAAITPVSSCSFSDVFGAGVTVTDCSGYYTGNLNNNADFPDVKTLLLGEFPGVSIGSGIIEQINTSASPVNFVTPVLGDTVVGVHWGGGAGGGNTSFYRLSIGAGYTGLGVVLTNPFLERGALSNVALYSTAAVPEPETYAMLLAGLGLIGFVSMRRKHNG